MKLIIICSVLFTSCSPIKNYLYDKIYCPEKITTNFHTEIPYEIINNQIICEVDVNGEKGSFIFDTGARSIITKSFQEKLKLTPFSTFQTTDVNDVTKRNDLVKTDIVIGQMHLNNYTLTIVDDFFTNYCIKIDGILGNEIFSLGTVYFDNKNKVIKISNSIDSFKLDLKNFFKVRYYRLAGTIQVKIKNRNYLIDTGYNGYVMTKYKSDQIQKNKAILNTEISGINSRKKLTTTYHVDDFILKKQTYKGLFASTPDLNLNLLGNQWFLSNNVIFDIYTKSLYLEKINIDTVQYEIKKIGFYYKDNHVAINVIHNSIATLEQGDIVIKINNLSLEGINSLCELDEKLNTIDFHKKIKLLIQREKQVYEVFIDEPYISLN